MACMSRVGTCWVIFVQVCGDGICNCWNEIYDVWLLVLFSKENVCLNLLYLTGKLCVFSV